MADYDSVLAGLKAIERTAVLPVRQIYTEIIVMWEALAEGHRAQTEAAAILSRTSLVRIPVICSWIRCPLHDDAAVVLGGETLRCTGCREVST